MAIAKLKTGETIELPFAEMQKFLAENPELLEKQQSKLPRNRRRYAES